LSDAFLDANADSIELVLFKDQFATIGAKLREIGASTTQVLFPRVDANFQPPMVVFSKGFTKCAFSNHPVRFFDGLRSITSDDTRDSDLLRFLATAIGSRLFRFLAFHAGSNFGVGRDQLHVYESLNLPFPLPDDDLAADDAAEIVREAADIIKRVERDGVKAASGERAKLVEDAKKQLEPLVEAYFSVNDTERILITDTLKLWQPSIHKQNLDLDIPALRFPDHKDRKRYADTLAGELNRFSRKEQIRISVDGMASEELNLVFATVIFGGEKHPYRETGGDAKLLEALDRMNKAAQEENGPISYLRGFTYCARDRVHILKPGTMRNWCRTAALNDADAVFEHLQGMRA
jgi:hypothetical protein